MPVPSFNTWTILFLLAAIQGVFISAVFLFRKEKHVSRYFLAAITFVFSVILTDYVLYWTNYQFYYPYLVTLPVCLVFTFGPLFYLYFKSIFFRNRLMKRDVIHFLPFVVAFLYYSPFIFMSVKAKQHFFQNKSAINPSITWVFIWLGIASMLVYCLVIFLHFRQYAITYRQVKKWFKLLCIFFACFAVSYLSYFVLSNFSFFNSEWDYAISFCMVFFIYMLGWAGYMQPKIFNGFGLFENEKTKYKNSPVNVELGKEIIESLTVKMREKKYFLYPDLSLDKLSELTGTNKHYLSQAINEYLHMNFFEYINSLRIEEAKQLLASEKEYTIIEIAYQVGYNNKVSFNKAFKNLTGFTPTEYKQRQQTVKVYQN
jgi:AraC-like DNA-binding protein